MNNETKTFFFFKKMRKSKYVDFPVYGSIVFLFLPFLFGGGGGGAQYFIDKKIFLSPAYIFWPFLRRYTLSWTIFGLFFKHKLDKMVRNYKRSNDSRSYKNYTEQQPADALTAISSGEMKFRETSVHFKISIGTLHNKIQGKHTNVPGYQTALTENEEKVIVDSLLAVGSWGFPFSTTEVQLMVSSYLKLI